MTIAMSGTRKMTQTEHLQLNHSFISLSKIGVSIMQKILRIAGSKFETVKLISITVTLEVEQIETNIYVVLKKDIEDGTIHEFHQFDTEVKAQRKFDRLTK